MEPMWVKVKTTKNFLKPVMQQLAGFFKWCLPLVVFLIGWCKRPRDVWLVNSEDRHLVSLKNHYKTIEQSRIGLQHSWCYCSISMWWCSAIICYYVLWNFRKITQFIRLQNKILYFHVIHFVSDTTAPWWFTKRSSRKICLRW